MTIAPVSFLIGAIVMSLGLPATPGLIEQAGPTDAGSQMSPGAPEEPEARAVDLRMFLDEINPAFEGTIMHRRPLEKSLSPAPHLGDLGLPDVVGQFSLETSGLIVLAGDSTSCRMTAYALAEHIGSATGRTTISITASPVPPGGSIRQRPVSGRAETSGALREEAAASPAPVILTDATLDTDTLSEMVKATVRGALVIAVMDSERQHPYVHLVDLIWAAEDWDGDFRRDFETALYAVVTQRPVSAGGTPETTVHPGNRLLRVE